MGGRSPGRIGVLLRRVRGTDSTKSRATDTLSRMIKQLILLNRADDTTFEEFEEYWLEEHAPLIDGMPGVESYSVDLATDPERSAYDGVAELYFEDMAALGEAWDSEAGEAAQADTANFVDADSQRMLIVEERVQFDRRGER